MSEILKQIAICTERGKVNNGSPYPPDMKGEDGVDELTQRALDDGTDPNDVLTQGLMVGMNRVGVKFSNNEVFVPDLLMAAKAMKAGMAHLTPHFESGAAQRKGTFVVGTVKGDLHDIGKNLVAMVVEGGAWEVIDVGVDSGAEKFLEVMDTHPGCAVGLSALLTTTMANMEAIVKEVKQKNPDTKVLVGGAPLTQEFCDKIGADLYSPDPQGVIDYLGTIAS